MLLKQHWIAKVIVIGLLANTCIETTGRFAMELGYHVTLVKDATAAFNKDRMHAGDELNGPTYAHAILYYSRSGCGAPAGVTPRRNRIHRSRL
jgi:nicotinamidase-related amidase